MRELPPAWDRLPPLPQRRVAVVPAFTASEFLLMVAIASVVMATIVAVVWIIGQ